MSHSTPHLKQPTAVSHVLAHVRNESKRVLVYHDGVGRVHGVTSAREPPRTEIVVFPGGLPESGRESSNPVETAGRDTQIAGAEQTQPGLSLLIEIDEVHDRLIGARVRISARRHPQAASHERKRVHFES